MWGNKSSRRRPRERKRLVMQSKIERVRIAFGLRTEQRRAAGGGYCKVPGQRKENQVY